MRTAAERREADRNTREAIAAARKTAQLARLLWPDADDEPLHSKVEILTQRLLAANQQKATSQVAHFAHPAAWRKHKHTNGVRDTGDVTQAEWWLAADDVQNAARETVRTARQTLQMAEYTGPTNATLRMVDAAYWAAHDMADEVESAREELPCTCAENANVLALFQELTDWYESLINAKDDLVAWATEYDHTIFRNPT